MINLFEVKETNEMIEKRESGRSYHYPWNQSYGLYRLNLDKLNRKIYDKITTTARNLVSVGEEIEGEFGIPIVNKRISVTPIALVGAAACRTPEDFVTIAQTLDRAAKEVGVNFLGGYSALVSKGMTTADELLIRSIPKALAVTDFVCSSINLGSTKTGINMDAVKLMGEIIKKDGGGKQREQLPWMRKTRCFLQCTGRQPVHGRRFPRRNRGGCHHQCRRFRSWCCQTCSGKSARRELRGAL